MNLFWLGLMLGIVILLALIAALMPRMGRLFFVADRSRLPFEETVDRIRERCEASDEWIIQDEKDYNAAYLNRGQGKLPHRLVEFKLGNPDHSYRVNHAAPEVSTFMPAAIAVVEHTPDKVVIYRKNTALMGRMFPEPMRSIMGAEVPTQLDALLNEIIG